MAIETLSGIPASFRAGATLRFLIGDSRYPSTLWTAAVTFRGKSLLTVAGVQSGTQFEVVVTAAQSVALLPGDYTVVPIYTEIAGAEKAAGTPRWSRVLPNLADATIGPWRTRYDAAMVTAGTLTTFNSVSVEGESYSMSNQAELQSKLNWLEMKALEEDRQRGISHEGGLRRIVTRM